MQPSEEGSKGIEGKKIKIGWSPPDITNVFKTATDYMEKAVEEANAAGLDVELITRSATEHTDAADQVKTLENFIQNKVDVVIVSPTEVEAIKPPSRKSMKQEFRSSWSICWMNRKESILRTL